MAEPHDVVVGTENALSVEGCPKLITLTDRKNLKVFFDTLNPWAMEGLNVFEILKREYPHLYSIVHAKYGQGNKLSSALLGEGDRGFSMTMAVFVENGNEGGYIRSKQRNQGVFEEHRSINIIYS